MDSYTINKRIKCKFNYLRVFILFTAKYLQITYILYTSICKRFFDGANLEFKSNPIQSYAIQFNESIDGR